MRLDFHISAHTTDFKRGFNKFESAIDDLTPVWKAVQQEFYRIEAEQFGSEGSAGGSKWQSLAPKYVAIKQAKYGAVPILTASGRLYRSLTSETSDSVVIINKQGAAFGTNLKYGKYHQDGGGRLPQRKPIDLSGKQQNRLLRTIKKNLLPYIKKTGFGVSE